MGLFRVIERLQQNKHNYGWSNESNLKCLLYHVERVVSHSGKYSDVLNYTFEILI